jgi:peptidoglycan-associated lipoprotein
MSKYLVVALLAAALVSGGCSLRKGEKPGAETTPSDASSAGAEPANAGTVGTEGTAGGPQGDLLSRRVIYFDFDRADIRADSQALISAHAKYVADNPNTRIRLEGHADEQGTREYNIGLGERRAQAVRRSMMLQGVGDVQLGTVSYGEERPAVAGSDEAAYEQNRRVEIVYLQ